MESHTNLIYFESVTSLVQLMNGWFGTDERYVMGDIFKYIYQVTIPVEFYRMFSLRISTVSVGKSEKRNDFIENLFT